MMQGMANSCELCTKLFELVQTFCNAFDLYKKQNSCIDFADLEHKALKVLDVEKARQEVKSEFKFVFVDEYQDINEIQEEIISRIKRENNLFLVGDVKQSIYAFRQCAPDIFVDKLNAYSQDDRQLVAYLNDNYRSHSDILDFTNHIFAHLMTEDFGGINYKKTSMLGHPQNAGNAKTNLKAINIDVVSKGEKPQKDICKPYSVRGESDLVADVHVKEAHAIAQRIREVVGLKILVDGKEKVITYNDVVLLTRGMNQPVKKMISELQSLGLPVVYTAKQNLFDSAEIKHLFNLFREIEQIRSALRSLRHRRRRTAKVDVEDIGLRKFHTLGSLHHRLDLVAIYLDCYRALLVINLQFAYSAVDIAYEGIA